MTDDKRDATFHPEDGPTPLPARQPWETFAQHGAPPEQPGRTDDRMAYASPGVPPWGSLSQDIGHRAPRKRRVWPWVLGAVVLVMLCGVGALVALGAGGKAVVDTVNEQATARAAEIKITSCTGPDQFGMVTVKYTIHNGSDEAQSYLPQFDLGDGKGTVYGQAADIVNNLGAGKDYKGSAANVVQAPKGAKIVCSVASS
jgi:hypothetical protein